MQLKNKLVIACAGSGKTWGICYEAKDIDKQNKKVLLVTYTNKGLYTLKEEYRKQNQGVLNSDIVAMTWYQFVLRELIKPYQKEFTGKIGGIKTIDFSEMYGISYRKKTDAYYYVTKECNIRANHSTEFALLLNTKARNKVIARLEAEYSCIYFDEIQDLAGEDVELLELLMKSSIRIYCVGDPKQATYSTHNAKKDKNKGGENIFPHLDNKKNCLNLEIEINNKTRRCGKEITDFANLSFAENPMISVASWKEAASGVYQIKMEDIYHYNNYFSPTILRYNKNTDVKGYNAINFGLSKGMTFDRVAIFPNNPITKFLINPDKNPLASPISYYIAFTRAKYSLVFFVEKFIENQYFKKETLIIGTKNIEVLRFINFNA